MSGTGRPTPSWPSGYADEVRRGKMKVYVIGPVTGVADDNLLAFAEARRRLVETGQFGSVGTPHDRIPSETPWADAMRISIRALLEHDAVAMLDGTCDSRGASLEREIALALGMPCKPVAEWLRSMGEAN